MSISEARESAAPPAGRRAARTTSSGVRPEIQALRAIAVLAVVLFHLWPGAVPGGYVGVDVFFVISGFLITGHLARELARTGRLDLPQFWARRARRLLPASLLVMLVTASVTYVAVPAAYWGQFFREITASVLYVENWLLASDAVDYLGAENLASPAQHYWSLSVEEQFYLVWPLLLAACIRAGRLSRRVSPLQALRGLLALLLVTSFAYSLWMTWTQPAAAYFVTPARVWQFAAGGLLALVVPEPPGGLHRLRGVVQWAGWAAIGSAVMLLGPTTPFPGYAALLPVLGALAVVWSGSPATALAPTALVDARPVQRLGDVSYSLYLWHWPPIVIIPLVVGQDLDHVTKVLILAGTLVAAFATKRWVEDPVRLRGPLVRSRPRVTLAATLAAMALVALVSGSGQVVANQRTAASVEAAGNLVERGTPCLGADAVLGDDHPCENPELEGVLLPDLAALAEDTGGAYACYDQEPGAELTSCTYGVTTDPAVTVALVGDSHAAMLVPGLLPHLDGLGWRLDTYVGRGCVWAEPSGPDDQCAPRLDAMQERLEHGERYDLVLVTTRRSIDRPQGSADPRAEAFAQAWRPVVDRGTRVVALADNPLVTEDALQCVARAGAPGAAGCELGVDEALGTNDPLPRAVELVGDGAHLVDLTDAYCQDGTCPMVVGNVVVYRDVHHITATFSKTLVPFFLEDVARWLAADTAGAVP
ncbi:acyltransferase family protein [Cellulomonas sp. SLBN-39]|uniref:acyltransferase family protein n=1 Tax=Cellulomonas sp. SLBN-39 TaxID=2768446 RepID=UPI00116E5C77|nr:acyltransferase family protein [Cellulomonas sp. SLBN-39]TQL03662.1 peptidoglycan/LPS O-acetylase OafA/YrhL [Cellulomonas sp. SLBN-39]